MTSIFSSFLDTRGLNRLFWLLMYKPVYWIVKCKILYYNLLLRFSEVFRFSGQGSKRSIPKFVLVSSTISSHSMAQSIRRKRLHTIQWYRYNQCPCSFTLRSKDPAQKTRLSNVDTGQGYTERKLPLFELNSSKRKALP